MIQLLNEFFYLVSFFFHLVSSTTDGCLGSTILNPFFSDSEFRLHFFPDVKFI